MSPKESRAAVWTATTWPAMNAEAVKVSDAGTGGPHCTAAAAPQRADHLLRRRERAGPQRPSRIRLRKAACRSHTQCDRPDLRCASFDVDDLDPIRVLARWIFLQQL